MNTLSSDYISLQICDQTSDQKAFAHVCECFFGGRSSEVGGDFAMVRELFTQFKLPKEKVTMLDNLRKKGWGGGEGTGGGPPVPNPRPPHPFFLRWSKKVFFLINWVDEIGSRILTVFPIVVLCVYRLETFPKYLSNTILNNLKTTLTG